MYKGPRIKALPAVFMLVLFLFASFFGFEGTLLCFGKDGHMAIEFVEVHESAAFGAQFEGMENDACGPCQDIQLLSSPAFTGNASHNTQIYPLAALSPMSLSSPSKEYPCKYVNLSDYSHYKTLASLQSVVLLI